MHRLGADLTTDQIQDWFKLGRNVTLHTIPRSKLKGLPLDPTTGEADEQKRSIGVPSYKRNQRFGNAQQTEYAQYYQNLEQDNMLREFDGFGGDTVSSVSALERLTADTISTFTTDHPANRVGANKTTDQIQLPEGMTEEEAVQVYQRFNFEPRYDQHLTITKHRQDIVDVIESNQVTIVQGETGSGKTTQVPQYILDSYADRGCYCNIIVTQPRRIAASSIARRVCSERNWTLGGICGYQVSMSPTKIWKFLFDLGAVHKVGLDKLANADTRLLYCTTGVLLQKLISAKSMNQYTHVILDEVHERDQDTDFCLLVVRKLLRTNSRGVKVVLMSATFDCDMFGRYFAQPIGGVLEPAPVFSVQGRSYEVAEYYLEDLRELGRLPDIQAHNPEFSPEAVNIAVNLIEQLDVLERAQKGPNGEVAERGSVLVFLPGFDAIYEMENRLQSLLDSCRLILRPLHSTITGEEQAKVFDRPKDGRRKVILSTNIAESSITVCDIKYVIDFCLTKNHVWDIDTNYSCLQLQWASKANCTQRKGRAGRVSNGRVYRLVPNQFFREHLAMYGQPEMQRCPLEQLVLRSKLMDMGSPKSILGLALSPPNLDDIERTVLLLKEVGALASLQNGEVDQHDGDLTFLGRVLGQLPIDIRLGKLIMLGHVFGLLEEAIIISASHSLKSFFCRPFKAKLIAYKHKLAWARDTCSDSLAYYFAFSTWRFRTENGHFNSLKDETKWCFDHFIELKKLREVDHLVDDLRERLQNFNIYAPKGPNVRPLDMGKSDNQLILKLILCGAFYPNYFIQVTGDEQEANREMSGHNPCTTVMVKSLPANHSVYYRQDIQRLFTQNLVTNKIPKVHFEGSRAFVEFPPSDGAEVHGSVLPAVLLALKLRQLRHPLEVNYIDPDTVVDPMNDLSLGSQAGASILSDNGTGLSFPPRCCQVALPTPNQTIIALMITETVKCGHFWARYGSQETNSIVYQLHNQIQAWVSNKNMPPPLNLEVGDYCLAPYKDATIEYYRARIESIDLRSRMVDTFFVDYGNTAKVPLNDLRPITPVLLQLPFQAFECMLCRIKPSAIKCSNGVWSSEATRKFKQLIDKSDAFYAEVYSIVHGILRVSLKIKMNTGQEVNVNEELVNLNFADYCEEPYLSQQNHLQREQDSIRLPSSFTENSGLEPKLDLRTVVQSKERVAAAKSKPRGHGKVTLSGPWNSLETKFASSTSVGRLRPTQIEYESVNSVCLNTEPQVPSPRLMVAAFVTLNPKGTSVTARDTTLMPHINGLGALVSLLFTPTAELRADRQKKKYIGALCGLGWNYSDPRSAKVESAFPEHDMEVTFDVDFDVEDLKMINGVRIAINLAIGCEDNTTQSDWGPDAVIKIQKSAREKLFKLISRTRKPLEEVVPFDNFFKWCQIDQSDILYPQIEEMAPGRVLLNLHNGIALDTTDYSEYDSNCTLNLKEKAAHQAWLEYKAGRSADNEDIRCLLCQITVHSPAELSIHLRTIGHREQQPLV